jgi:hypothetical protein
MSASDLAGGSPLKFADVAVMGEPENLANARAAGWALTRMAIVLSRAQAETGTMLEALPTIVKGPGQKLTASLRMVSDSSSSIPSA